MRTNQSAARMPIALSLLLAACAPAPRMEADLATAGSRPLHEAADGWESLFDGSTLRGWHVYGRSSTEGWAVEDGVLVGLGRGRGGGGDLVTDREYGSFDLSLEWKISPGGNSGVLFHVVEDPARFPATYHTGPEYQLIDEVGFPHPLEEWQRTAANYAMHVAEPRPVRPAGEWNHTRIRVEGSRVEHWLNGVRVVEYELGSADWERRVREGKWKDFPAYGRAGRGRIALQDHDSRVWFRNLRIRPLD